MLVSHTGTICNSIYNRMLFDLPRLTQPSIVSIILVVQVEGYEFLHRLEDCLAIFDDLFVQFRLAMHHVNRQLVDETLMILRHLHLVENIKGEGNVAERLLLFDRQVVSG